MKEYLPVLCRCQLFQDIEEGNVEAMLGCLGAVLLTFEKGQTLLAEGSPARYLGIVLSGAVQGARVDYYGNRSILASIGQAGIFGESFACAEAEALPEIVNPEPAAEPAGKQPAMPGIVRQKPQVPFGFRVAAAGTVAVTEGSFTVGHHPFGTVGNPQRLAENGHDLGQYFDLNCRRRFRSAVHHGLIRIPVFAGARSTPRRLGADGGGKA